ncbi:MAG TPA: porin [Polyangiaceae bacterium]|nr:porin [Polyangiaceae bacterium]
MTLVRTQYVSLAALSLVVFAWSTQASAQNTVAPPPPAPVTPPPAGPAPTPAAARAPEATPPSASAPPAPASFPNPPPAAEGSSYVAPGYVAPTYAAGPPGTAPGTYAPPAFIPTPPPPGNQVPPPAPVSAPTVISAPPEAAAPAWYDGFTIGGFADAYAAVDFNFPKAPGQTRYNPVRAYDTKSGFSLSWVGLDLQKEAKPVGGTLALRFGPTAQTLAAACPDLDTCDADSSLGLSYVKQAFVSFKPGGSESSVTLDLGKFDTPYGVEVAESQFNVNYTRGILYWLGQPAYHTGLRVGVDASRNLNLKFLAVNGWNRTVDNNAGKTFGLQGTYRLPRAPGAVEDMLTISVGYLVGPEHGDSKTIVCQPGQRFDLSANPQTGCVTDSRSTTEQTVVVDRGEANTKGLRHFLDLAVVASPTSALKLLFNASFAVDNDRELADTSKFTSSSWFGVMGGARYALSDAFGLAGRIEYYADPDGVTSGHAGQDLRFVSGTGTLDYSVAQRLRLFLDARLDWSSKKAFPVAAHDPNRGTSVSAALGAVFMTN